MSKFSIMGSNAKAIRICDDESTDGTKDILDRWYNYSTLDFNYKQIKHTGLPETVKNEALKMLECKDDDWVLMLDADERFAEGVLAAIRLWITSYESTKYSHVYFEQLELVDGQHVRTFQKCKLFRKGAVMFPLDNIHADDQFKGDGIYMGDRGWQVHHRKGSWKQITREKEYLETYKRLLDSGKIDEGRYNWLKGLHMYYRD